MPVELAKKIIDEVSEPEFQRVHGTQAFVLGENGDLFLNKACLEIMRYIRIKCPTMGITIFTNFQNANQAILETIHKEKLVDFVNCNIDSVNEDMYHRIKGIDLSKVLKNLKLFFDLRRQYASNIPVQIYSITLYTYVKAIYDNFGVLPAKADRCMGESIYDDFDETRSYLEKLIDPAIDRVTKVDKVMCWAERERVSKNKDFAKYQCTNLSRVMREAFIAPNGDWYICCYDAKNEVVLGNVGKESLHAVFFSTKRTEIINHLANQRFRSVGGPCCTVNCCQFVGLVNEKECANLFLVTEKAD
ncbi:hypothetical protein AXX12_14050 [Anaerosporomusa subterranea]|uniref:4Fe4S-binding SPASM domain-containing protein n=1 Tax=Anaerosporomusa subterranea TaxID=1794912 RepID=A0A154BMR6_ANASB|nr:hypothetical protein AXX12_14050 [Anaerosporomusa subterranea]